MKRHKPVPVLPFRLHDISDFVNQDHPIMFPEMVEYQMYWDEQTRRCLEGHWGLDKKKNKGGWRWMPGNLYFYINMGIIKMEGDYGQEVTRSPLLRDIEWKMFYAFTTCDGFAGFDGDDKYTCFRPIGDLQKGKEISNLDKILIERYHDHLVQKDGKYKKYIEAREYLYKTHPEPLGKPLFLNQALNLVLLSTRRVGKSYSVANGLIGYDFTFNGAKTFEDYVEQKTSATTVVGSIDSKYSTELLGKFTDTYDHLQSNIGAYYLDNMNYNGCYWLPTAGSLGTNKKFTNRVKAEGGQRHVGPGSKIIHVSYMDNPSAGVGYGARHIVVEESGLMDNFEGAHGENDATQIRDTKYGWTAYIGTGGNITKIQGIKDAFNNPKSYNALPYKDIYNGTNKDIGLFFTGYSFKNLFRDPQGNLDYKAAFEDLMREREEKREGGSKKLQQHILSFPVVPQEMFMHSGGNCFPTDELERGLNRIDANEYVYSVGMLKYLDQNNKRQVKWYEDTKGRLNPIIGYGDEDDMDDLRSAIIVHEHPSPNKPAPTFKNPMYIVVYDPVKDEEGTSLAAVLVFKAWELENFKNIQYNIVAEWYGRMPTLEGNHEIALMLARYYGAKVLPEINNKDFVRYAKKTNRFRMLQPKPGLAIDGMTVKQKKEYPVGVYISPGMKPDLETYSAETFSYIIDKDERIIGDKYEVDIKTFASECRSKRVVEEGLFYHRDGNFDAISALHLISLFTREMTLQPMENKDEETEKEAKYEELRQFMSKQHIETEISAFNY